MKKTASLFLVLMIILCGAVSSQAAAYPYEVSFNVSGKGNISILDTPVEQPYIITNSTDDTVSYIQNLYGFETEITFTSSTGYEITSLIVDDVDISIPEHTTSYIFNFHYQNVVSVIFSPAEEAPAVLHTVTFIADDTQIAVKTVNDGEALTDIPTVPAREGFTGSWDVSDFSNITSDMTVTATYAEITPSPVVSKNITVSNEYAKSGENVTVTVSIDENTNMAYGTMLFNYDSTKLTPVSYSYGSLADSTSALANLAFDDNKIKASFVGAHNISAGGNLLSITFTVNENVENDTHIAVNLESAVFRNENNEIIPLNVTSGDIHVLNYTLGDVNNDGTIDIIDSFMILRYGVELVTLSNSQLKAADVNLDGNVNIFDAVLIQKYDLGLINTFEPATN